MTEREANYVKQECVMPTAELLGESEGDVADNKTTELTAMECLRNMLDERGVEWREWTKGQVETKWFVPSGMTEFDAHFCSASVSKNRRNGPLHYRGYVISPQAAIEASLGKADDASANVEAIGELRDLACDIHAAEIIDHVHITHRGWTFDSQWLDSWHDRFDSIADKLERAMATTGRPKAKSHPYGYERDTGAYDCTRCECGCINDISAAYCNDCGGEIEIDESAEKEYYDGYSKHTVFAKKHDDGSLEFCERRYVPEDTATLGSEREKRLENLVRSLYADYHGEWPDRAEEAYVERMKELGIEVIEE